MGREEVIETEAKENEEDDMYEERGMGRECG